MEKWQDDDTFLSKWLNDELSEEEKRQFESSEAGKDFIKLISASELIAAPSYDVEDGLRQLQSSIEGLDTTPVRPLYLRPTTWMAVAACIALLIVASVVLNGPDTEIYAGIGQQELVELPDGSEVRLHANSTLSYDAESWAEERKLELEGEAFFDVTKGSTFTVQTSLGDITVLGTSFNVRNRGEQLTVSCYTGKVNVQSGSFDEILTPGKRAIVDSDGSGNTSTFESAEKPTWMNGITSLEEVPFEETLEELKSLYDLDITYDGAYDTVRYTGSFPHNDPEIAIQLILDPLSIRYTFDKNSNSLTILSN